MSMTRKIQDKLESYAHDKKQTTHKLFSIRNEALLGTAFHLHAGYRWLKKKSLEAMEKKMENGQYVGGEQPSAYGYQGTGTQQPLCACHGYHQPQNQIEMQYLPEAQAQVPIQPSNTSGCSSCFYHSGNSAGNQVVTAVQSKNTQYSMHRKLEY